MSDISNFLSLFILGEIILFLSYVCSVVFPQSFIFTNILFLSGIVLDALGILFLLIAIQEKISEWIETWL